MSSSICPDCRLLAFKSPTEGVSECRLCGWKGKTPPRKKMYPEDYMRRSEETQKQLEAKKQGKLFYLKIYLKCTGQELGLASLTIQKILSGEEPISSETGPEQWKIITKVSTKPSEEVLKKIKSISKVNKVNVF